MQEIKIVFFSLSTDHTFILTSKKDHQLEMLCPIALRISMKNGTQLHNAKTGQNETLHQRVKTINESEIAPAEWRNVARMNTQLMKILTMIQHTRECYFISK
jgi:hypothetical protein